MEKRNQTPAHFDAGLSPQDRLLASAQRNGGLLSRDPSGTWRGAENDLARFPCEMIHALVREKRAEVTRYKEGSKIIAVEIKVL